MSAAGPNETSVVRPALEQAPPFAVPLRFMLTAPLFAVAAAGALAVAGPQVMVQRWDAATVAITHLITLGLITMTMLGALLQLLPVVAGASVPAATRVSAGVHAGVTLGTVLLAAGLWAAVPALTAVALVLLGGALAAFVAAAGTALSRVPLRHPTVRGMALALVGLAIAAGLGIVLAIERARGVGGAAGWVDLHLAWALVGWVALLVTSVAYQVVPMFQLTPEYPAVLRHGLGPGLVLALVAWSVLHLTILDPWWDGVLAAGIAVALAAFALVTVELQRRRRRPTADVTLRYWQLSMACLLACVVLWLAPATPRTPVLLGVLFLAGFAGSVVAGMLYKIVPFLTWLHGRGAGREGAQVPAGRARLQLGVHAVGLAVLCAAAGWPEAWTVPAAILVGLGWLLLWVNLVGVVRRGQRQASPVA